MAEMLARNSILWFGSPPNSDDSREARNRDLRIDVVGDKQPNYRSARAAIFWATSQPYFVRAAEALEKHLVDAIDEGLFVFVVVSEQGQLNEILRIIKRTLPNEQPKDRYRVRTMPVGNILPHEGPNTALTHNPGPAANSNLAIRSNGLNLGPQDTLLLQRAFHDCTSISLKLISGGMSGAQTFIVDAVLAASNAGPFPMPFFVKLHTAEKLRQEMQSFKDFAEFHVPWHLRPNFAPDRCLYGVHRGILVGSFVPGSRSLWEVAREGAAIPYIQSLFGETLAGLRVEDPHPEGMPIGSIAAELESFCRHEKIPEQRVERAKAFGGEVHSPNSLWRKLLGPYPAWRRCSMHGDMHGENVRVRKSDAIVIDLAHATKGPMSADLASLEVWLAFKVAEDETLSEQQQWQGDMERLYAPEVVDHMLLDEATGSRPGWLADCLREIRTLAAKSVFTADEYKRVLAIYILRWASFKSFGSSEEVRRVDEHRRAYAYWLANRLIVHLCAASEQLPAPA